MKQSLCFLMILLFNYIHAQPTFNNRYSLGFDASGFSSVVTKDSGYYVTGLGAKNNQFQGNTQAIFAFFDTLGQLIRFTSIIGENGRNIGAFEGNLNKYTDSVFITAGVEFGSGTNRACLFKYNSNCETIWVRKFYSPNDTGGYIKAEALTLTDDFGFLIASSIQPAVDLDTRVLITKTDSSGNELWHQEYRSPSYDYREEWPVLKNINGQIVMAAWRWKSIWATTSNYEMQHQFWWLDSLGGIERSYTTPLLKPGTTIPWKMYPPFDFVQTKDKGWVVATGFGVEENFSMPNPIFFQPYIYKLDSNLNFVWDKEIKGYYRQEDVYASKLLELEDSSFIVVGQLLDYKNTPDTTPPTCYQGFIANISANGDSIWTRRYYGLCVFADNNTVKDFKRTTDGGYILCGESSGNMTGQPHQQGWLLKLDSMGCLIPGCHITAVENIAGQEEKIDIKVYPNPVRLGEYLNFYIPKIQVSSPLQVHLYNIEGQLLQNHSLPSDDATYMLPTEGMTAGTYILHVLDEGGRILGVKQFAIR